MPDRWGNSLPPPGSGAIGCESLQKGASSACSPLICAIAGVDRSKRGVSSACSPLICAIAVVDRSKWGGELCVLPPDLCDCGGGSLWRDRRSRSASSAGEQSVSPRIWRDRLDPDAPRPGPGRPAAADPSGRFRRLPGRCRRLPAPSVDCWGEHSALTRETDVFPPPQRRLLGAALKAPPESGVFPPPSVVCWGQHSKLTQETDICPPPASFAGGSTQSSPQKPTSPSPRRRLLGAVLKAPPGNRRLPALGVGCWGEDSKLPRATDVPTPVYSRLAYQRVLTRVRFLTQTHASHHSSA